MVTACPSEADGTEPLACKKFFHKEVRIGVDQTWTKRWDRSVILAGRPTENKQPPEP